MTKQRIKIILVLLILITTFSCSSSSDSSSTETDTATSTEESDSTTSETTDTEAVIETDSVTGIGFATVPTDGVTPDFQMATAEISNEIFNNFLIGGNVWEWTKDWYRGTEVFSMDKIEEDFYIAESPEDPKHLKGLFGGSFNYFPATMGVAWNHAAMPNTANDHFGFRVIK